MFKNTAYCNKIRDAISPVGTRDPSLPPHLSHNCSEWGQEQNKIKEWLSDPWDHLKFYSKTIKFPVISRKENGSTVSPL